MLNIMKNNIYTRLNNKDQYIIYKNEIKLLREYSTYSPQRQSAISIAPQSLETLNRSFTKGSGRNPVVSHIT